MADEYFYALTLKGAKASEVWDPEAKGAEDYQGGHKLIIKQALLGPDASDGEVNVIQVEAMTWKESIKIPVAVLKSGSSNQVLLDLSFPDPPVTFSLVQGTGPVHIIGHHLIGSPIEEFEDIDEMDDEMLDDEEEGEEGAEVNDVKRKRKLSNIEENEEEDEDDDEGPKNKKAKSTNAKGKTPVKNAKKK
ncbi:hypothetical protein FQA39_LY04597 [Lamprigera yunnana]|nr:hypothetical protein FQA39_LY04597 [Lamprigera yunnana]